MKRKWWHDKVAYQIYPKSFLDSDGDGVGEPDVKLIQYCYGIARREDPVADQ